MDQGPYGTPILYGPSPHEEKNMTRITGEITITPPLTWREFKDSRFFDPPSSGSNVPEVKLKVEETSRDTDEGEVFVRLAVALVPERDEQKAYHLTEHVQEAVDGFPDHEFGGHLECFSPEYEELWRIVVRNGTAHNIKPVITWPEPVPACSWHTRTSEPPCDLDAVDGEYCAAHRQTADIDRDLT